MTDSLIIVDRQPDLLWRAHLQRTSPPGTHLLDLDPPPDRVACTPHYYDPRNWRRWLTHHAIDSVHLYQPGHRTWGLLAAAAGLQLDIHVHITGAPAPAMLRQLKVLSPQVSTFCCPAEFIARDLRRAGLDRRRITVQVPQVPPSLPADCRPTVRHRVRTRLFPPDESAGTHNPPPFIILALPTPEDTPALRSVVWAAAILRHAHRRLLLIVAGLRIGPHRRRLEKWQSIWRVPGLVHLDDTSSWPELLAGCDLLLAPAPPPRHLLRLLYARAAGAPIVAAAPAARLLAGYPHLHRADTAEPRSLALAAWPLIENLAPSETNRDM